MRTANTFNIEGATHCSFGGGGGGGGYTPSPPPKPPAPGQAAQSADRRGIGAKPRTGMQQTVLTSGLGDTSDPNLKRRTLLGG